MSTRSTTSRSPNTICSGLETLGYKSTQLIKQLLRTRPQVMFHASRCSVRGVPRNSGRPNVMSLKYEGLRTTSNLHFFLDRILLLVHWLPVPTRPAGIPDSLQPDLSLTLIDRPQSLDHLHPPRLPRIHLPLSHFIFPRRCGHHRLLRTRRLLPSGPSRLRARCVRRRRRQLVQSVCEVLSDDQRCMPLCCLV